MYDFGFDSGGTTVPARDAPSPAEEPDDPLCAEGLDGAGRAGAAAGAVLGTTRVAAGTPGIAGVAAGTPGTTGVAAGTPSTTGVAAGTPGITGVAAGTPGTGTPTSVLGAADKPK